MIIIIIIIIITSIIIIIMVHCFFVMFRLRFEVQLVSTQASNEQGELPGLRMFTRASASTQVWLVGVRYLALLAVECHLPSNT